MTGPEHFTEAERLLAKAQRKYAGKGGALEDMAQESLVRQAHVHAMLALAAATAMQPTDSQRREWLAAMRNGQVTQ